MGDSSLGSLMVLLVLHGALSALVPLCVGNSFGRACQPLEQRAGLLSALGDGDEVSP